MTITARPAPQPSLRESQGLVELFIGGFRRDVLSFYPQCRFEVESRTGGLPSLKSASTFRLIDEPTETGDTLLIELFGGRYRLTSHSGTLFTSHDRRMVRAVGAVLSLRCYHVFQSPDASRLELFRGGSEDHYIAAFVDPGAYAHTSTSPSRIASTIQTLRTTALSTYENRRVSTGALLLGPHDDHDYFHRAAAPDAMAYGVDLTSLKSIHRLCDGKRTLFLVDQQGKLVDIIDVKRWAAEEGEESDETPCARPYTAHARATRGSGHVCLVLSPNQEIKLFAAGAQAFAFAHGRWRILDPQSKFTIWRNAVQNVQLARVLFQAALDLAENREGGLFVVVSDPREAIGRLIAPHDLLAAEPPYGPPPELTPGDPLAKRALHYLARNRDVTVMDPSILESFAGLDGALATDRAGRLLAFGAILRHDATSFPPLIAVEGARTTAAIVASKFGPVLKVSEDGVVSCYLNGVRVWDL